MPYKLIVAENSVSVRKIIETAFPDSEFSIRYFGNGDELASELSNLKFDAVLLNTYIPGKDGYEIAKIIRDKDDFNSVPMIFLRGAFDVFDAVKLSGLSYDGVFTEPFDSEGLVGYVRELIESRKDPATLPEELPLPAETKIGDEWMVEMEDKIERIILRKIREIEKGIEKRIRASLLEEKKQE
ncbi:MAG: response regulator [Candidatus Aminicenantes bacterium]|nr:response regulator [Candidatus Aminicenantes bacterium]